MKRLTTYTFLSPQNTDQDVQRREFILNVLLFGFFLISIISLVLSFINLLDHKVVNGTLSLFITAGFLVLIAVLWKIARIGYIWITNYLLLSLIGLVVIWLILRWSYELPVAELCYGLLIVMSGVLLSAKSALRFSAVTLLTFLAICYAQAAGWLHPRSNWLNQPLAFGDAIGYAIIFCTIMLISWLANREIDRSLFRARRSETALAKERDSLEVKVIERTKELEATQAKRLIELQRFAEFGRLSANLLHEVANPLTAASLNMERLDARSHSRLALQVRKDLQLIERYISATRKQLAGESEISKFNVGHEVRRVLETLDTQCDEANTTIILDGKANYYLVGDPIKFSQVLRNLLCNAIEAYATSKRSHKKVQLSFHTDNHQLICEVRDWGSGIKPAMLDKVFDPFYSTKKDDGHNLGIGLSMVKQFMENDFKGNVALTSTPKDGTSFRLTFDLTQKLT